MLNLLPLLQNAPSLRRIVSVAAATCEGAIDTDNMAADGFALFQRRNQIASMATLLLEEVARRAPTVALVHTVPGIVQSGITRDARGLQLVVMIAISRLLGPLVQTPPADCGETHLFVATSSRYPPGEGSAAAGVPLAGNVAVARGSDGKTGSGVYTVDNKGESAPAKVEKLLATFREDGTAKKVWDYVASDFERITGGEVAA